jgi:hypothetical protein
LSKSVSNASVSLALLELTLVPLSQLICELEESLPAGGAFWSAFVVIGCNEFGKIVGLMAVGTSPGIPTPDGPNVIIEL